VVVAGEAAPRAPHILNLLVPGVDSEAMLMHLDLAGIAVSGGSACASGAIEPSHVLLAMGYPRELAAGAVRLSLRPGDDAGRHREGGGSRSRGRHQGPAARGGPGTWLSGFWSR
jgi:cysteine sulfinate desulfinase/cysteine desulfurase-like protein